MKRATHPILCLLFLTLFILSACAQKRGARNVVEIPRNPRVVGGPTPTPQPAQPLGQNPRQRTRRNPRQTPVNPGETVPPVTSDPADADNQATQSAQLVENVTVSESVLSSWRTLLETRGEAVLDESQVCAQHVTVQQNHLLEMSNASCPASGVVSRNQVAFRLNLRADDAETYAGSYSVYHDSDANSQIGSLTSGGGQSSGSLESLCTGDYQYDEYQGGTPLNDYGFAGCDLVVNSGESVSALIRIDMYYY